MTWRAPDGCRYLRGAEATLVKELIASMAQRIIDDIEHPDDQERWQFDVDLFDALTPTQQLTLIRNVAEHLLTETDEPMELTATNEAAAYAIFRTLSLELESEIETAVAREYDPEWDSELWLFAFALDDDPTWSTHWRSLSLYAYRECFPDQFDADQVDEDESDDEYDCVWLTPHDITCTNAIQWEMVAEGLADRVLWDRDFEMAEEFLDLAPAQATVMKRMMGIDNDYFVCVAPDSRASDIAIVRRHLQQITNHKSIR